MVTLPKLDSHDWVQSQYMDKQYTPAEIGRMACRSEESVIAKLKELDLWTDPYIDFPENRECRYEDKELCERFLSWFCEENKNIYRFNQKGNKFTIFFHRDLVYSNGRRLPYKRMHCYVHAYYDYLKSKKWKEKSRRLRIEKGYCEICGSANDLHCHHLTYDRLGDELDEDLQVLCGKCHKRKHPK